MKILLPLVAALILAGGGFAQHPDAKFNTPEQVKAEADFKANGPKLFSMADAEKESARTGIPVACWVGKNMFRDPAARELSRKLGETTIQAAMDDDGTPYDKVGPRLKFTTDNYAGDGKTYYVPVAKFGPDTEAKVLKKMRGIEK